MLPNFYAKGANEWDEPSDPDCSHFQERRDELLREYARVDEIPPAIHCVAELKHARAWLACLKRAPSRVA